MLATIAVAVFVVGMGLGMFYQFKKDAQKISATGTPSADLKVLSSDIITAVAAFGNVTDVNGRNITISYNGKSLTLNIGENVAVTSFTNNGSQKNISYSDIKKGDSVNAALKINPDGQLTAQTVLVLSSSK